MQDQSTTTSTGVLNTALEIARKRAENLKLLRAALESGDDQRALDLARKLCGLIEGNGYQEKGARVN